MDNDHCYDNYCLTFFERVMLNRTSVSISATAIEPKCAELGLVSMRTPNPILASLGSLCSVRNCLKILLMA
jgi:hypothetical protein